MRRLPAWLALATAVTLDAATTRLGLANGLAEQGPLASRLLPLLGPAYWPLALLLLYSALLLLAKALARRAGASPEPLLEKATQASLLVYLIAAWTNYLLATGG